MSLLKKVVPLLLLALVAAALDGCSSAKPKFQDDQLFSSTASPYARNFDFAATDACEAARRGLLSQGYMTTMTRTDAVDATKNFQPASDSHIVVEVHVVCTTGDASNTSIVYVNAIQNGYALKKSDTSASVGLSIFGSLSVPIRTNSDAMVKISSETIQSGSFYDKFFELVGRYLRSSARSEPVPHGSVEISPLPPPVSPSPPVAVVTPPAPAVALATRAVVPVIGGASAGAEGSGKSAASAPAAALAAATPATAVAPTAAAAPATAATATNVTAAVEAAASVQPPTTAAAANAVTAALPGIGMPPMLTVPANNKATAEAAPTQASVAQPASTPSAAAQTPIAQTSDAQNYAAQILAGQTPTAQTPTDKKAVAAAATPSSEPTAAAPTAQ